MYLVFATIETMYDHKEIEKRQRERAEHANLYRTENTVKGKENYYVLFELPYPSGNLHVGHWYAYAIPDTYARYKQLKGYNVLYPIGFDSFGLPAENAAIKHGKDPREWTYQNINTMREQIKSMGTMMDWSREIVASDPSFIKWNQWLFTQFMKEGIAYRASGMVNWCPSCNTVIANEQVVDGSCERCDSTIEKREMPQWNYRITQFADALIDDLDDLDWPEHIKESQRTWIGRSEGAEIDFEVKVKEGGERETDRSGAEGTERVTVFTTRPDTLYGATYMVLAPEHPLVKKYAGKLSNSEEILAYVSHTEGMTERDRLENKQKTGVYLDGLYAINPANKEPIPIYVADYVLVGYGTGAIMAVPAHDERDAEFAKAMNEKLEVDLNNPPQEEMNTVERESVLVFIRDAKTGKMAIQDLHGSLEGVRATVMGGVEKGQTLIEAALQEMQEEIGLQNKEDAKVLRISEHMIRSRFCASHKGENRISNARAILIEIASIEALGEIAQEERDRHSLRWVEEQDLHDELTPVHQKVLWQTVAPNVARRVVPWIEKRRVITEIGEETQNTSTLYLGEAREEQYDNDDLFTSDGILINSGEFDGRKSEEVKVALTAAVGGRMTNTYRQRDWSVARQRYWGCPIPVVYDPDGNAHAVPEEHLPWTLPDDVDHTPDGTAPLARSKELMARTEKIFGKGWKPEVETFDTFVDSSWYFYRYLDPENDDQIFSEEALKAWASVDIYFGGAEHTTLHVLYARFYAKVMHHLGIIDHNEPFKTRINRGLILGPDGNKMSKSKGNVIDPDSQVAIFGADAVRMYLAFLGPFTGANYPWDPNGIVGVKRFLERMYYLKDSLAENSSDTLQSALNTMIGQVSDSIENLKFNTAVSALMIFSKIAVKEDISSSDYSKALIVLSAFAPYLSEELWQEIGNGGFAYEQSWPEYAVDCKSEQIIAVQVNGKVRGKITVTENVDETSALELAQNEENVAKWLSGSIKKVIYIPGKIINIIV